MAKNRREKKSSILGTGVKGLASASLAVAGGWILYSNLAIDHEVTLPDALPAERKVYLSNASGQLSYYLNRVEGGRPLVLIHSINAAASAYEMRPLFLRYHSRRPVFALDLPGFGFSSRQKRIYSPALYEAAVLDFLQTQVGEPADVVALSLGSEFAARAALVAPERFSSLTLISPTGFSQRQDKRGPQAASRSGSSDFIHPLFSLPVWARPFYDLLTTRTSIKYFLEQSFVGAVPQDLIDYAYATAHQPDAEHAPLYFLSGKLFTPNIRRNVYERLQVPTLVLYDRDNFTSFETLPELLSMNKSWQGVRLVPTLGMPHFERTEDVSEVLDRFWE
jgi:pimeloyl-ACP methyl ester carboxylesterase